MNNKGISLIEVIIIVAVMGIMTGGIVLTFSIVNSVNTKGTAESVDSALEKVKTESMSKEKQTYLVIYKSSDASYEGYYMTSTTDKDTFIKTPETNKKIAAKNLSFVVNLSDGTSVDIASNCIFISFDRASGAFGSCFVGDALIEHSGPKSIVISGGGRTNSIQCIPETGKHFVE